MSNSPYPTSVAHRGGGKFSRKTPWRQSTSGQNIVISNEFDAKLSKDGEIFLLHDDNLNVPATAGASRVN